MGDGTARDTRASIGRQVWALGVRARQGAGSGSEMSAEWQPRRTSATTRRFKVWFGGIFLTIGLVALLIALIVYLVLSQVLGMGALIWAFIGAPLGVGVSFSALGGMFVWLGLRQARTEQRLRQFARPPREPLSPSSRRAPESTDACSGMSATPTRICTA